MVGCQSQERISHDSCCTKRGINDSSAADNNETNSKGVDPFVEDRPSKRTVSNAKVNSIADDTSESVGTNSQWLLSSSHNTATVVLHDNLGDASAMVESLTHQVNNWCLTNLTSSSSSSSINNNNGDTKKKKSNKAYKQRCRRARREVMRSMLQQTVP